MLSSASGGPEVRAALEAAEQIARDEGAAEVSGEHVLLALARLRPGHAGAVLERHKVTPEDLEKARAPRPERDEKERPPPSGPLPPAPEVAAAVSRAGGAAGALGRQLDASDLLLAMLQDRAAGTTALLAKRFGLSSERLIEDLARLRGQERAVAKAEGGPDACAHHAGAAAAAGVEPAAAGGTGLAAELRDLEARHRALCENVDVLRDRVEQLRRLALRLTIMLYLLIAAAVALAVLSSR